jgi:hypothetical protein
MGHKAQFYLECAKQAWRGSIDIANAWAPLVGAAAIWIVLEIKGKSLGMPDTIQGTIGFGLMCVGAAWVIFFVIRLFLAFGHVYSSGAERSGRLLTKIAELEGKLLDKTNRRRVAEQLSICMMEGRNLMARYTNPIRAPKPSDEEVTAWQEKTGSVVSKELGTVHYALYETPDGAAPVQVIADHLNNITWNGIKFRVQNLKKIIDELRLNTL